MSRDIHTFAISASLDPDEHPEEAAAWDHLAEKVRELLAGAGTDPKLAAIADALDPTWSLEVSHGPYRAYPAEDGHA
ncbi:hypothetical protein [Nonomuraea sp. KM90]|uniref:hypothetical protein n=1 Tax=Nonomuraea sp. KM90 TaxID=3457428 RepID=UPI003FCC3289